MARSNRKVKGTRSNRKVKGTRSKGKKRRARTNCRTKQRRQTGGRTTFFPGDLVTAVRSGGWATGSLMSAINGVEPSPHPGPTLDHHPISH